MTKNHICLFIGFFVFTLAIVRVVYFGLSSIESLVAVVSDDAFYYIQIAKRHSFSGHWTFDGSAASSGFHLLYGYLLSFIYKIFPELNLQALFFIIGVTSSLAIGASSFFISKLILDFFGKDFLLIGISPFLLGPTIVQSSLMMESWLVIFFSSLTIFLIFSKSNTPSPLFFFKIVPTCIFLGIFGSFARSDYGMLPMILFFSILLVQQNGHKNDELKKSFFIFLGAALGILFSIFHTYLLFGHYFQASADVKYYWSSLAGHPIISSIELLFLLAFPFLGSLSKIAGLILCVILLIFICLTFVYAYKKKFKFISPNISCFFGSAIAIFGYLYFYSFNSQALQVWYLANFIAPVSICLSSIFYFMFRDKNTLIYAVIFFFIFSLYIGLKTLFYIPYPHQISMIKAGIKIKYNYLDGNFGSWNSGIFSFFSGRPIVNIDGLVNDEVFRHLKSNSLIDYIKDRRIAYLIDYQAMLETKVFRIKGGYDDDRVDKCISTLAKVDDNPSGWGSVTIYKVNLDCF